MDEIIIHHHHRNACGSPCRDAGSSSSSGLAGDARDGEGARRPTEGRLTVNESMVCLFRAVRSRAGRRAVKRGGTCATRSMAGAVKVRRFNFVCAVVFFCLGSVRSASIVGGDDAAMMRRNRRRRVCQRNGTETPGSLTGTQTDEEVCETNLRARVHAERNGARELHGGVEGASRTREGYR